jgi:Zn-dependent protease/CBS domain-containing protein
MSRTTTSTSRRPAGAGGFRNARTIFHVAGVPIRIDLSWFLIAALVVWILFAEFGRLLGDFGTPVVVAAAVAATLLFFASLLAHELGHALTNLERGIPVTGVTLFLLGGVTESTREARRARDEFVIVGIGPFISLVLAAAFGLLYTLSAELGSVVAGAITGYLAWINLLLAIFNLVPGYPLDGGRLLRALIWGLIGQPHKATRWAARVGQGFAVALGAYGVWWFAFVPEARLNGVWAGLIALFLFQGAAQSHQRARMMDRLANRTARDVMGTVPPTLDPGSRLSDAVVRVQERPTLLWPVGTPVAGGVTLEQVDAVPRTDWSTSTVADVAIDADTVTVEADTPMDEVIDQLRAAPKNMLVVVDAGRAVGLLTPSLVSEVMR